MVGDNDDDSDVDLLSVDVTQPADNCIPVIRYNVSCYLTAVPFHHHHVMALHITAH